MCRWMTSSFINKNLLYLILIRGFTLMRVGRFRLYWEGLKDCFLWGVKGSLWGFQRDKNVIPKGLKEKENWKKGMYGGNENAWEWIFRRRIVTVLNDTFWRRILVVIKVSYYTNNCDSFYNLHHIHVFF